MASQPNMIREMLAEELDRNARATAAYETERDSLPRGSVTVKRRGDKAYCYLKYRDGGRTVTDYAGTAEAVEGELRRKVERRRVAEAAIRQLEAERRYIERAAEGMSAAPGREEAFWRLVGALDESSALPHVMIVGTWTEWLYADHFAARHGVGGYRADIGRTHDIDVFFRDHLMEIEGAARLRGAGFVPGPDFRGTFFYEGIEVEFLAPRWEAGAGVLEIPSAGVEAERLRDLDMLRPAWVDKRGYRIMTPTPAPFAAHKLYINPNRRPESKRGQDIRKVAVPLRAMTGLSGELDGLGRYLDLRRRSRRASRRPPTPTASSSFVAQSTTGFHRATQSRKPPRPRRRGATHEDRLALPYEKRQKAPLCTRPQVAGPMQPAGTPAAIDWAPEAAARALRRRCPE